MSEPIIRTSLVTVGGRGLTLAPTQAQLLFKILEKIYYLIYIRQFTYGVDLEEYHLLILIHHYIGSLGEPVFVPKNTIQLCHLAMGPEI
jgi:hypothetical protein